MSQQCHLVFIKFVRNLKKVQNRHTLKLMFICTWILLKKMEGRLFRVSKHSLGCLENENIYMYFGAYVGNHDHVNGSYWFLRSIVVQIDKNMSQ